MFLSLINKISDKETRRTFAGKRSLIDVHDVAYCADSRNRTLKLIQVGLQVDTSTCPAKGRGGKKLEYDLGQSQNRRRMEERLLEVGVIRPEHAAKEEPKGNRAE